MSHETYFVDGKQAVQDLGHRVVKLENTIDFSVKNVSSGYVCQALKVPKGMVVIDQGTKVIRAEGSAASCNIGDSAASAGFDASVDLNSSASLRTINGTDAYAKGREYTADDTIDLKVHGDLTNAKILVWAIGFMRESS